MYLFQFKICLTDLNFSKLPQKAVFNRIGIKLQLFPKKIAITIYYAIQIAAALVVLKSLDVMDAVKDF